MSVRGAPTGTRQAGEDAIVRRELNELRRAVQAIPIKLPAPASTSATRLRVLFNFTVSGGAWVDMTEAEIITEAGAFPNNGTPSGTRVWVNGWHALEVWGASAALWGQSVQAYADFYAESTGKTVSRGGTTLDLYRLTSRYYPDKPDVSMAAYELAVTDIGTGNGRALAKVYPGPIARTVLGVSTHVVLPIAVPTFAIVGSRYDWLHQRTLSGIALVDIGSPSFISGSLSMSQRPGRQVQATGGGGTLTFTTSIDEGEPFGIDIVTGEGNSFTASHPWSLATSINIVSLAIRKTAAGGFTIQGGQFTHCLAIKEDGPSASYPLQTPTGYSVGGATVSSVTIPVLTGDYTNPAATSNLTLTITEDANKRVTTIAVAGLRDGGLVTVIGGRQTF